MSCALTTTEAPVTVPPAASVDLREWDVILVNTSAGKDSQAMLDVVVEQAKAQGVLARVHAVHADLGEVEWDGTRELAERQVAAYGLPFHVVSREQGLLEQVEARGMWPSNSARYCTSDHKRDQVAKLITQLVRDLGLRRQARVLSIMGLRAQESPARKKLSSYEGNLRLSNNRKAVYTWLPIHHWTTDQVWARIAASATADMVHPAYAKGMPRLSCSFCVLASRSALVRAAQLRPDMAAKYAGIEARIGHSFQNGTSMADIIQAAAAAPAVAVQDWTA